MILKFKGRRHYHGHDDQTGKVIDVDKDQSVDVSEKMADRLNRDFPGDWERSAEQVKTTAAAAPKSEAKAPAPEPKKKAKK